VNAASSRWPALLLAAALAAGTIALSCSHGGAPPPAAKPAAAAPAPQDPLASFETMRVVLQSPRCQNCHPPGDAPLQGDDSHVHQMNVKRGPNGRGAPGLECATCHGDENPPASYGAHIPPGVSTEWHLPPPEMKMVFVGLSPRALCEQLKDLERNGGKDMKALEEHLHDPLVTWGWTPGYGRKPVPIAYADFLAAFRAWAGGGAPCPER
jgi:hypothetical protein